MKRKGIITFLFGLTLVFSCHLIVKAQTGVWVRTGDMNVPRWGNAATLLASGKVLVTGGCSLFTPPNVCSQYASAPELYDPATGTWTATTPMVQVRGQHTATLMQDGRVLVAGGGTDTEGCFASAEIFDPNTELWVETGAMSTPRCGHHAALIQRGPNAGMVMVFSGSTVCGACQPVTTAELYDPTTGTWKSTGSLAMGRFWSVSSDTPSPGLADGNIMVIGGLTCCPYTEVNEAEIYDVLTGEWNPTSDKVTRAVDRGVTLQDGTVLVTGGWTGTEPNNQGVPDTEMFNASGKVWSGTGPMSIDRFDHTLTTLASGQVLVAGGCDGGWSVCNLLKTTELYDSFSGAWFLTGSMKFARSSHHATLLSDGKLLVSGGYDPYHTRGISTAELFAPPPAIALSHSSVKFAVQLVGTVSGTKTLSLTVPGTNDLHISSISVSGDFLQRNTCGFVVAAGGSCTIIVGFRPTAKGNAAGTVTITDDAVNSPQQITLSGTGTVVQFSPAGLDFGSISIGTTSDPQSVTVTNIDTSPMNIAGVGISGPQFGDFAESTTCGPTLAGGASCTITVTFTPTATGTRKASLTVNDNGGGSPQRVHLLGAGI